MIALLILYRETQVGRLSGEEYIEVVGYLSRSVKVLRELGRKGIMTIIALHDPTYAYRYSDKGVMIRDSRVFAIGKPEEVLTEGNIEGTYEVKVIALRELST